MKKALMLLLAVLTCIVCLAACGEKKPLRICVDLADSFNSTAGEEVAMQSLLDQIAMNGGPEDIELEVVPVEEAERKSYMTRVRTEVMAGEGPDLFIMQCQRDYLSSDFLFQMPEKSMGLGLFYPLDEFLEDTQFMQWDQLTAPIMEAGKSEKWGQVILPLTYTFPVTVFRTEDITDDISNALTWEDMVSDQTGYLATSTIWARPGTGSVAQIDDSLGLLADFENNKLLFTEEDLLARVEEQLSLIERDRDGAFDALPDFYQTTMRVEFESDNAENDFGTNHYIAGLRSTDALTFVPVYADDGGVTATITSFGAINANTKRAEDAFYILDYLLSEDVQQNSAIYEWMTGELSSIPVQSDLMQPSKPVNGWSMNEETYAAFTKVRDQITFVKFGGLMDHELNDAFGNAYNAVFFEVGEDSVQEIVSETYRILQMELSE